MATQPGGYNTYIGARYVPIFDGEWDNTKQYEPLTIVQYKGDTYTSKTYVPVGIDITNTTYWVLTGAYNAQVEEYRKQVEQVVMEVNALQDIVDGNTDDIATNTSNITKIENKFKNLDKIIVNVLDPPDNLQPMVNDGVTDNSAQLQAIVNYCGTNGGVINLASGRYVINSQINIENDGIDIVGNSPQQCYFINNASICLNYTSARYCSLKNVGFESNNKTAIGVNINGTDLFLAEYLRFRNFEVGMLVQNSANSLYNYIVISTDGSVASAKGMWIQGASISSYFNKIIVNLGRATNGIGILASGSQVADNIYDSCDIADCNIGIQINGESQGTQFPNTDISINNSVIDGTVDSCISIFKCNANTLINILGGWLNSRNENVALARAISIQDSEGVTVSNVMFQTVKTDPRNTIKYVHIINSSKCKVVGCSFINGYYHVAMEQSSDCLIANNTTKSEQTTVANSFCIADGGCKRCIINCNSISGYYDTAIETVTGSDRMIITNNLIDKEHVNFPITNAATNSIVDNNLYT